MLGGLAVTGFAPGIAAGFVAGDATGALVAAGVAVAAVGTVEEAEASAASLSGAIAPVFAPQLAAPAFAPQLDSPRIVAACDVVAVEPGVLAGLVVDCVADGVPPHAATPKAAAAMLKIFACRLLFIVVSPVIDCVKCPALRTSSAALRSVSRGSRSLHELGDEKTTSRCNGSSGHWTIPQLAQAAPPKTRKCVMAKMCPMSGCKSCEGLCIHDKIMIGMGLLVMLGVAAHWGLHLI